MISELKPLYASLRRAGISNYLVSKDFKNKIIEIDFDEEWSKCLKKHHVNPLTRLNDYEEIFSSFLDEINIWSPLGIRLKEGFTDILVDFLKWSPAAIDYKPIYECIKKLDYLEKSALKSFADQARKINATKISSTSQSLPAENLTKRNLSKVFVIHGHDTTALLELEKILKEEFQLVPVILQQNPNDGLDTIFAKFERLANECALAIALFTPDDKTVDNSFRARQNVILEFGYFLGRDQGNNRKIIVLEKGKIETPSDINGVLNIRFNKSVNEVHLQLKKQLAHWKIIK